MRPAFTEFYETFKSRILISESMFKSSEIKQLLELRYIPEFENHWLRVSKLVDEMNKSDPLDAESKEAILKMKQASYQAAFRWTQNSELAGLVYDDIELIGIALAHDYNDEWLTALKMSYMRNCFPSGHLT